MKSSGDICGVDSGVCLVLDKKWGNGDDIFGVSVTYLVYYHKIIFITIYIYININNFLWGDFYKFNKI